MFSAGSSIWQLSLSIITSSDFFPWAFTVHLPGGSSISKSLFTTSADFVSPVSDSKLTVISPISIFGTTVLCAFCFIDF